MKHNKREKMELATNNGKPHRQRHAQAAVWQFTTTSLCPKQQQPMHTKEKKPSNKESII
jgi:hypothetical protein